MAIEVINRLKFSKVLIICKASIKTHWQRKLEEWLTFPFVDIQIIQKKTDIVTGAFIIVNYDLISHSHIFHQLKQYAF